ncbi:hypothetical protein V5279_26935 [Bradyrhizobium sp. 26S5]
MVMPSQPTLIDGWLAVLARHREILAVHRDRQVFGDRGTVSVKHAPGAPGVHVDDDDRGMRSIAARADILVGDVEFAMLLVDHDVLRLRPRPRHGIRHVIDALEPVAARIPSDQFWRDVGAESHVDDPDHAILVRAEPEHVVEILVGALPRRIPLRAWKRLECRRRRQLRDPDLRTEERVMAEDQLVVRRDGDVADRLGQPRHDLGTDRRLVRTRSR